MNAPSAATPPVTPKEDAIPPKSVKKAVSVFAQVQTNVKASEKTFPVRIRMISNAEMVIASGSRDGATVRTRAATTPTNSNVKALVPRETRPSTIKSVTQSMTASRSPSAFPTTHVSSNTNKLVAKPVAICPQNSAKTNGCANACRSPIVTTGLSFRTPARSNAAGASQRTRKRNAT